MGNGGERIVSFPQKAMRGVEASFSRLEEVMCNSPFVLFAYLVS
jgi:hypothetical protein